MNMSYQQYSQINNSIVYLKFDKSNITGSCWYTSRLILFVTTILWSV